MTFLICGVINRPLIEVIRFTYFSMTCYNIYVYKPILNEANVSPSPEVCSYFDGVIDGRKF